MNAAEQQAWIDRVIAENAPEPDVAPTSSSSSQSSLVNLIRRGEAAQEPISQSAMQQIAFNQGQSREQINQERITDNIVPFSLNREGVVTTDPSVKYTPDPMSIGDVERGETGSEFHAIGQKPGSYTEVFARSFTSTVEGFKSSIDAFTALGKDLSGADTASVLESLAKADRHSELGEAYLTSITKLDELMDGNVDHAEFTEWLVSAFGSVVPSLLEVGLGAVVGTLIAGPGFGTAAGAVGKSALGKGAAKIAKQQLRKEWQEGVEDELTKMLLLKEGEKAAAQYARKILKGEAVDAAEHQFWGSAHDITVQIVRAIDKAKQVSRMKKGAVAGASAALYPIQTGDVYGEAAQVAGEVDEEGNVVSGIPSKAVGLASLYTGAGLTAIALSGEVLVAKYLAKRAFTNAISKKPGAEASKGFLKEVLGGTAKISMVEGVTEAAEDLGAQLFRLSYDEMYELDSMRLFEAFATAAAGTAPLGFGGAVSARSIRGIRGKVAGRKIKKLVKEIEENVQRTGTGEFKGRKGGVATELEPSGENYAPPRPTLPTGKGRTTDQSIFKSDFTSTPEEIAERIRAQRSNNPEPIEDIIAQIAAVMSDKNGKTGVWLTLEEAEAGAAALEEAFPGVGGFLDSLFANPKVTEDTAGYIDSDQGYNVWGFFSPSHETSSSPPGFFLSINEDSLTDVKENRTNENSLARGLGYSGIMTGNVSHVVQVKDQNGNVIHREGFEGGTKGAHDRAVANAKAMFEIKAGYSQEVVTVDADLADRKRRRNKIGRVVADGMPSAEEIVNQAVETIGYIQEGVEAAVNKLRELIGGDTSTTHVNEGTASDTSEVTVDTIFDTLETIAEDIKNAVLSDKFADNKNIENIGAAITEVRKLLGNLISQYVRSAPEVGLEGKKALYEALEFIQDLLYRAITDPEAAKDYINSGFQAVAEEAEAAEAADKPKKPEKPKKPKPKKQPASTETAAEKKKNKLTQAKLDTEAILAGDPIRVGSTVLIHIGKGKQVYATYTGTEKGSPVVLTQTGKKKIVVDGTNARFWTGKPFEDTAPKYSNIEVTGDINALGEKLNKADKAQPLGVSEILNITIDNFTERTKKFVSMFGGVRPVVLGKTINKELSSALAVAYEKLLEWNKLGNKINNSIFANDQEYADWLAFGVARDELPTKVNNNGEIVWDFAERSKAYQKFKKAHPQWKDIFDLRKEVGANKRKVDKFKNEFYVLVEKAIDIADSQEGNWAIKNVLNILSQHLIHLSVNNKVSYKNVMWAMDVVNKVFDTYKDIHITPGLLDTINLVVNKAIRTQETLVDSFIEDAVSEVETEVDTTTGEEVEVTESDSLGAMLSGTMLRLKGMYTELLKWKPVGNDIPPKVLNDLYMVAVNHKSFGTNIQQVLNDLYIDIKTIIRLKAAEDKKAAKPYIDKAIVSLDRSLSLLGTALNSPEVGIDITKLSTEALSQLRAQLDKDIVAEEAELERTKHKTSGYIEKMFKLRNNQLSTIEIEGVESTEDPYTGDTRRAEEEGIPDDDEYFEFGGIEEQDMHGMAKINVPEQLKMYALKPRKITISEENKEALEDLISNLPDDLAAKVDAVRDLLTDAAIKYLVDNQSAIMTKHGDIFQYDIFVDESSGEPSIVINRIPTSIDSLSFEGQSLSDAFALVKLLISKSDKRERNTEKDSRFRLVNKNSNNVSYIDRARIERIMNMGIRHNAQTDIKQETEAPLTQTSGATMAQERYHGMVTGLADLYMAGWELQVVDKVVADEEAEVLISLHEIMSGDYTRSEAQVARLQEAKDEAVEMNIEEEEVQKTEIKKYNKERDQLLSLPMLYKGATIRSIFITHQRLSFGNATLNAGVIEFDAADIQSPDITNPVERKGEKAEDYELEATIERRIAKLHKELDKRHGERFTANLVSLFSEELAEDRRNTAVRKQFAKAAEFLSGMEYTSSFSKSDQISNSVPTDNILHALNNALDLFNRHVGEKGTLAPLSFKNGFGKYWKDIKANRDAVYLFAKPTTNVRDENGNIIEQTPNHIYHMFFNPAFREYILSGKIWGAKKLKEGEPTSDTIGERPSYFKGTQKEWETKSIEDYHAVMGNFINLGEKQNTNEIKAKRKKLVTSFMKALVSLHNNYEADNYSKFNTPSELTGIHKEYINYLLEGNNFGLKKYAQFEADILSFFDTYYFAFRDYKDIVKEYSKLNATYNSNLTSQRIRIAVLDKEIRAINTALINANAILKGIVNKYSPLGSELGSQDLTGRNIAIATAKEYKVTEDTSKIKTEISTIFDFSKPVMGVKAGTQAPPSIINDRIERYSNMAPGVSRVLFAFEKLFPAKTSKIRIIDIAGAKKILGEYERVAKTIPEHRKDELRQEYRDLKGAIDNLEAVDNRKGVMYGGEIDGKRKYTIVVKSITGAKWPGDNKLSSSAEQFDTLTAMVVGHELGHVIADTEFDNLTKNRKLLGILWDQYKVLINTNPQYTEDAAGFKEWFSDQVSVQLVEQASTVGEETLEMKRAPYSAKQVRKVFKRVAGYLRKWAKKVNEIVFEGRMTANGIAQEYLASISEKYINREANRARAPPDEDAEPSVEYKQEPGLRTIAELSELVDKAKYESAWLEEEISYTEKSINKEKALIAKRDIINKEIIDLEEELIRARVAAKAKANKLSNVTAKQKQLEELDKKIRAIEKSKELKSYYKKKYGRTGIFGNTDSQNVIKREIALRRDTIAKKHTIILGKAKVILEKNEIISGKLTTGIQHYIALLNKKLEALENKEELTRTSYKQKIAYGKTIKTSGAVFRAVAIDDSFDSSKLVEIHKLKKALSNLSVTNNIVDYDEINQAIDAIGKTPTFNAQSVAGIKKLYALEATSNKNKKLIEDLYNIKEDAESQEVDRTVEYTKEELAIVSEYDALVEEHSAVEDELVQIDPGLLPPHYQPRTSGQTVYSNLEISAALDKMAGLLPKRTFTKLYNIGNKVAHGDFTELTTTIDKVRNSNVGRGVHATIGYSDTWLRNMGPPGTLIADFLQTRPAHRMNKSSSVPGGRGGYHDIRAETLNKLHTRLLYLLGVGGSNNIRRLSNEDQARIDKVLIEAEDERINTMDLSPTARKARELVNSIQLVNVEIQEKHKNYFHRQINIEALKDSSALQEKLVWLILQYTPRNMLEAKAFVKGMVTDHQKLADEELKAAYKDKGEEIDPSVYPAIGTSTNWRTLKEIPTTVLREHGILEDPFSSVLQRLRDMASYSAYVDAATDRGYGHDPELFLTNAINDLPEDRREPARRYINRIFGRYDRDIPGIDTILTINAWGAVATSFQFLLFAGLASLPDLAGPAIRTGTFDFSNNVRNLLAKNTRQDNADIARAIGATGPDMINTMYINLGAYDISSKKARKYMDGFFHYTGLNMYTNFSREFASGMGRDAVASYIVNSRSSDMKKREKALQYLEALDIAPAEIEALVSWAEATLDGDRGIENMPERVKDAIAAFVREAISRPNPATRSVIASDPRAMLAFLLKHFFYDYFFRVVRPAVVEVKMRTAEGDYKGGSLLALGALGGILALTMLSLEMRELIKGLARAVIPGIGTSGSAFISNAQSTSEYAWNILGRSGLLGPATLAVDAMSGLSPIAPLGIIIPMFEGDVKGSIPIIQSL